MVEWWNTKPRYYNNITPWQFEWDANEHLKRPKRKSSMCIHSTSWPKIFSVGGRWESCVGSPIDRPSSRNTWWLVSHTAEVNSYILIWTLNINWNEHSLIFNINNTLVIVGREGEGRRPVKSKNPSRPDYAGLKYFFYFEQGRCSGEEDIWKGKVSVSTTL